MRLVPFNKELREKYPFAVKGHKKNCTCFVCNIQRISMWKKDNPMLAERAEQQIIADLKEKQEAIKATQSNAKIAKANRDKVLTGNKSYKIMTEQGMDTLHCAECGQRLGALSFGCPLDEKHHGWVFGKMLNNPADKRWDSPLYNKSKFLTTYETSIGIVQEVSSEEQQLKERMKKIDKPEDLI